MAESAIVASEYKLPEAFSRPPTLGPFTLRYAEGAYITCHVCDCLTDCYIEATLAMKEKFPRGAMIICRECLVKLCWLAGKTPEEGKFILTDSRWEEIISDS